MVEATAGFRVCCILSALDPPRLTTDVYAKTPAMKTPPTLKGLTRWVSPFCTLGVLLLRSVLTGELRAQDFEYRIANGSITTTNYTGPGGNVAIPANIDGMPVKAIGGQAFLGRPTLTAITIPDSVTNIEDGFLTRGGVLGAFAQCGTLTNVSLGNGVLYIGMGTFTLCTSLTRVSISDSVTTVGDFAFHNCEGLTEVRIGKSVTQLGPGIGYAFDGSTNLTSVVIPGNVTNLGNYAFAYSASLANVTIENGVTRIGDHAFHACPSLTNVTLPASVTTIADEAFAGCANLAGAYFKGNAPALTGPGDVFYYSSNVTVYYLPGTTGWGPTYAGRPTMLWNPHVQTTDGSFGVRQNRFGFNIAGTAGIPIVIEASTDLAAGSWVALQSWTLTNGLVYFSDPLWTNYPNRFYRIRSP